LTISAETIGLAGSGIGQELSPDAALESADVQRLGLSQRLAQLLRNRLVRQNLVLFFGGLVAGIGGFVYHAIAGRVLGPATYGQVAFLIAVYSVGTGPALILIVRTVVVVLRLRAGYAVSGSMAAVLVGLAFVFCLGLYSLRDHFRGTATRVRLRVMAGFSLTAAAGIIGVQILYNQDVILAEHYLNSHDGGIYGGLNKIGTILFFLTLSVSQGLFPRVVEAVANDEHPGRILLWSAVILTALGAGALLVFA